LGIFKKSVEKIQVSLISDKITGILHEDQYTFIIISRSRFLRMKNVSDKNCRENRNKHFTFNNFFSENLALYEIMWKNNVELGRPQITGNMAHAHCML